MKCTIEVKMLPLVGVSGHLYLEIFDETGKRICQVNGLATDAKTGKTKSMGFPGDVIKAYLSDDCGIILAASARCSRDDHNHVGRVIFEGTREEIDQVIKAMRVRAAEINKVAAPYKIFSLNSNTVFREMVEVAAHIVRIDRAALAEMANSRPLPGVATDFNKAMKGLKENPKAPKPPKPRK